MKAYTNFSLSKISFYHYCQIIFVKNYQNIRIICLVFFFRGSIEQTLFYVDVFDQLKIPIKREDLEVIEYTIPQIKDIIAQTEFLNGSSSFIFGLTWFLIKKSSVLKC